MSTRRILKPLTPGNGSPGAGVDVIDVNLSNQ